MKEANKLKAQKLNQQLHELENSLMVFNIENIVNQIFNQDLDKNVRFYFDLRMCHEIFLKLIFHDFNF